MKRTSGKRWILAFLLLSLSWQGCATHVISSKKEMTGKIIKRDIPARFYANTIKVVGDDPNNLKFQIFQSYATREAAHEVIKIETIQQETFIFPLTVSAINNDEIILIPLAVPLDILGLVFNLGNLLSRPSNIDPNERRKNDTFLLKPSEVKTLDPSMQWRVDEESLKLCPVSKKNIRIAIDSLGYRKALKTDRNGSITLNLRKYLSEIPQDIRILFEIEDDESGQPLHYDISKDKVARYLKAYPRYPAVLRADAKALGTPFGMCGQGNIRVILHNQGKGSAMGVRIAPVDNSIFKTQPVEVGTLEPGERREFSVPFQVISLSGKDNYLRLETTERFGHDANPLRVEVPLTEAHPEIEISRIDFKDGQTGFAAGNGNGIVENGEVVEVSLVVRNKGDLPAHRVAVTLSSEDVEIMENANLSIATLPAGKSRTVRFGMRVPRCYAKNLVEISAKAGIQDQCFTPVELAQAISLKRVSPHLTPAIHIHDGDHPGSRGNQNNTIENGERVSLEVEVLNTGGALARNSEVAYSSTALGLDHKILAVGDIPSGESVSAHFMLEIPREFSSPQVPFELSIKNDSQCEPVQQQTITLPAKFIRPDLNIRYKFADGSNNGIFEQGGTCRMLITVANEGPLEAENVVLEIKNAPPDIDIPEWKHFVGRIPAHGASQVIDTTAFIKRRCEPGKYDISLMLSQGGFKSSSTDINLAVSAAAVSTVVSPVMVASAQQAAKGSIHNGAISLSDPAPVIFISEPANHTIVTNSRIQVVVNVIAPLGLKSLTIANANGATRAVALKQALQEKQVFKELISLNSGENDLLIEATDLNGMTATETLRVTFESDTDFYKEQYAVLVGLDAYLDKEIPKLKYAVEDARGLKKALVQYAGFKQENIIELFNATATREEILYQIKDNLRKRVGPNDSVFFFFAGHGDTLGENTQVGCLLAYNTIYERIGSTGISIAEIEEASKVLKSRHNLFVLDSCFSGLAGFRQRSTSAFSNVSADVYTRKMMKKRGNQIITAGMKDEKVIESDDWGHSVFSYYLIKGIQGAADKDSNNIISAGELIAYLQPRVTSESNGRQTPQLRYLGEEGEYMFRLSGRPLR